MIYKINLMKFLESIHFAKIKCIVLLSRYFYFFQPCINVEACLLELYFTDTERRYFLILLLIKCIHTGHRNLDVNYKMGDRYSVPLMKTN